VNRDHGNPSNTSDWLSDCNLVGLRETGVTAVSLFLDISGSLTFAQVEASYHQFLAALEEEGLDLKQTEFNQDENWILPHIRDFAW